MAEMRRLESELCEKLVCPAITPDIEFVAYLQALSQFGFFRLGPITIDANVVEDILMRTHPRGQGDPEHPTGGDAYVRLSKAGWKTIQESGRARVDELHLLLTFMRWGEGLPLRVFGELGVSPEDVERYVSELGSAASPPRSSGEKLYSTEQAADYLGVHVQTVRAWIRSGKLPASRLAGQKSIRIRESDLQSVLEPIDPRHLDE
jgi:excisionase family DNA binding protein